VTLPPLFDSPPDTGDPRVELNADTPDADQAVVTYENLTADQQAVVREAVSDPQNAASLPSAEAYGFWSNQSFVRHENTTYRVLVTEET